MGQYFSEITSKAMALYDFYILCTTSMIHIFDLVRHRMRRILKSLHQVFNGEFCGVFSLIMHAMPCAINECLLSVLPEVQFLSHHLKLKLNSQMYEPLSIWGFDCVSSTYVSVDFFNLVQYNIVYNYAELKLKKLDLFIKTGHICENKIAVYKYTILCRARRTLK